MMELTVRTLHGAVNLRAVPEEWTLHDLKTTLHEGYPNLQIPEPCHQNLVQAGRLLSDGPLHAAGLTSGSTIVLLHTIAAPKATPLATTPAPTASDIRAAIFEEARRRGIEHKLRDEAPTYSSHSSLNLPSDLMDMDNQLMGLIEALEGRLGLLRQGGRPAAAGGTADAASDVSLLSGPGDVPAQQRAAAAETQASEPIPDVQPPEPEAEHVTTLCDMGFSEAVVRKALVLHRNRVPEAVDWLLVHSEDADAAEPVTQEQLRRIYGTPQGRAPAGAARAVGAAGEGSAAPTAAAGAVASALRELHMSLLQAVGIDADSAQGLLDRTDGPGSTSEAAGLGPAQAQGQTAQATVDPLEAFRRRLQQQLGNGRQEDLDAAASSLADLFPLETLMNLGVAHEEEEHDHDDDEDEGEEEEGEEEEEEEEEEDDDEEDEGGHDAAAVPESFHF